MGTCEKINLPKNPVKQCMIRYEEVLDPALVTEWCVEQLRLGHLHTYTLEGGLTCVECGWPQHEGETDDHH